jgi:hypothetical protein
MRSRPERVRFAAVPLALCVLAALACGPRYAREVVREREGLKAVLRAELRGGDTVDRGFTHPATIAGVRLAHVLSRIDVRLSSATEGGERRAAIATELVYPLGDLLSEALARANPSQEVVIQAIRKERRLGLFTQDYYTSFVAYVEGDLLFVHLSRVDSLVSKGEESPPEPFVGRTVMAFRVLPAEGVTPVGPQAVSAEWRSPLFRAPSHVRIGPGGRVIRRTILLESPPEGLEHGDGELPLPTDPEVLRALAELEEARQRGAVSESDYHLRRGELLREGQPGP